MIKVQRLFTKMIKAHYYSKLRSKLNVVKHTVSKLQRPFAAKGIAGSTVLAVVTTNAFIGVLIAFEALRLAKTVSFMYRPWTFTLKHIARGHVYTLLRTDGMR